MRRLLIICLGLAFFSPLYAQEQEGTLVNRLLRPNTSLGNSEQNKKFFADRASVYKRARVATFYLQRKQKEKTYSNTREFASTSFKSRSFDSSGSDNSLLAARSTVQKGSYALPAARTSVELRDGHKQASTSDFAGNRPFLEKGKSQKSLDRKNPPMTIEQVRELLNKSK